MATMMEGRHVLGRGPVSSPSLRYQPPRLRRHCSARRHPPPRAGATTKSNPAPATLSGRPEPSASPAPGSVDDTIWDPASKTIVDAWLLLVSPRFLLAFSRGSHSISPSNASDARRATNHAASTWYTVSHATAAPSPVWVAASSRSSPRLGQSGRTTSGAGS